MVKRLILAGAAVAFSASVGLAQDTPREPPAERRFDRGEAPAAQPPAQPAPAARLPGDVPAGHAHQGQTYKAKAVLGSKVSIQGGLAIGTVDDIVFTDDGYIEYVVVLNEGKYVVVPWQAAKFDFRQRQATVNITQQQFQQVPTFTVQSWPTFDASYRTRVYDYYGLPAGQERRIERRTERRNP